MSQFDLHSLYIFHVCRETIKRYQRAGVQICDITTCPPLQECISFELCPAQPYASSQLADSLNEYGSALLDSPLICEELQTSLNKKRWLNDTSKDGLSSTKFKNKESSIVTQFHKLVSCGPHPASILRKSTSGRHRPVSYPDGPMTARYRFT